MIPKKIKWSIITSTKYTQPHIFARFIDNLTSSIDPRRTEIIFVGDDTPLLQIIDGNKVAYRVTPAVEGECYQNTGCKLAQGEYLFTIDNNTLVPKNFLIRFAFCLENTENVGIVVPITNTDMDIPGLLSIQRVVKSPNADLVEAIQEKLDQNAEKKREYIFTGEASNFCMFFPKKIYEEVGAFNDSITSETSQASEFMLRALRKTYYTAMASDIYVYRSAQFKEEVSHLFVKDYEIVDKKLCACYRIKIDVENDFKTFTESLQKVTQLTDYILVLDDNSKVKVKIKLQEQYPELWKFINRYEKHSRPFDERRDYNDLLSMAEQLPDVDWVLMLDDNDVPEENLTRATLQRLMNPINLLVQAYTFQLYYMWDEPSNWRSDGLWSSIHDTRLCKLIKGMRITKEGTLASMCGYVPDFPRQYIKDSSVRFKCFHFLTPPSREVRKVIFEKADNSERQDKYKYFTDTLRLQKRPWSNNNTVSFYSPVNRSNVLLYEWLDHVWYFANEVVVGVDALDEDTISDLQSYGVVVTPTSLKDSFADGRNKILKACTKDYIFQLDVDERLSNFNWYKLSRITSTQDLKHWMFSIDNIQKDGTPVPTETIRLFPNDPKVFYTGIIHETLDDYVRKYRVLVGTSPFKLVHYGYVLQNKEEAFKKMQRYLELNLNQMKATPLDSRPYYNLSLHLLEDEFVDDAMALLELAVQLPPKFALPEIELAHCHTIACQTYYKEASKYLRDSDTSTRAKIKGTIDLLERVKPFYSRTAPGHAASYFQQQPQKYREMQEQIKKTSELIAKMRAKTQAQGAAQKTGT